MSYIVHVTHAKRASRFTHHILPRLDAGLLLAALLTLFIIQNLLQTGLPTLADLPIHLYRTLEYGHAWAAGVIVPRWASNLAYGYGYPLFVFAPPLPYWLGLAFYALGFSLETAFKILIILTILLYAIGMYLLARDLLRSVEAGLVAATAYVFAPFALREALLYGGNVPQFLAIGLFPWTLWAMVRAAQAHSWIWTVLAACFYAGVLLSHLFQALIFTPVVGVFGLILLILPVVRVQSSEFRSQKSEFRSQKSEFRSQSSEFRVQKSEFRSQSSEFRSQEPGIDSQQPADKSTSISSSVHNSLFTIHYSQFFPLVPIPLGLLLAAFFWLPAFTERVFTRAQTDIYLAKSPFYVRYPYWTELVAWILPLDARAANPYVPLTLGVVTLALAVLGFLLVIKEWSLVIKAKSFPDQRAQHSPSPLTPHPSPPVYRLLSAVYIFFFALVAILAVFLALPMSRPVWETITILQVAEFPWRMLGLVNLGLAFLAGAAVLWSPSRLRWPVAITCLCLQIVAVAPYLYPVTAFTRYGQITIANQVDYERRSQSIGTTTLGEYLPQTVHRPPTTSPLVKSFLAGQYPERLDRSSLPAQAKVRLVEQTAVTHVYQLDSPTGFTLRFFQFDYPGWQAQLNGQPTPIKPEPETGLILIDIPAGQHTLTLRFGETPGRILALALTGLTIGGLIFAGIWRRLGLKAETLGEKANRSPAPLPLRSPALLLGMLFIIMAAFWLKPLLRPVFTIDSPPSQALPALYKTEVNFANGIQLIGYDLDKKIVQPGKRLQAVLYWQTTVAPIKANLQPFVHIDRLDNFATVAGSANYTPGDTTTESVLPTFHWDTARYVRDEHDLIVPPETPPFAYAVRIGLIDPDRQSRLVPLADGSGDTAQLTVVNVAPDYGQTPQLAEPLAVSFDAGNTSIHLTGFQLDSVMPEQLHFRLTWQAEKTPSTDYTVFAQLLDWENNLVAGYDRPPLDGAYPTSTWLPGQVVIDPRFIPLDNVPAGEYRLVVGLYDPTAQQRLRTAAGTDFVELTKLTLDQP